MSLHLRARRRRFSIQLLTVTRQAMTKTYRCGGTIEPLLQLMVVPGFQR